MALFLLISQAALAHGEEVLVPIFFEFIAMILVFVIVALIKLKIIGKLILDSIYIISAIVIFLIIMDIPYRANKILINTIEIIGPTVITCGCYLIIKNRFKK